MSDADAAGFIHDIISLDFFLDLRGSNSAFFSEVRKCIKPIVKELLAESRKINKDGEVVESDEDSQGNLR